MIVIPPLEITDARLTSTNVPLGPNAEWLVGTSYSIGNLVADNSNDNHNNYENLISGAGKLPQDFSNSTDPAPATVDWLDLGATNRWAMFDRVNGTQTINANTIDVTLLPNAVVNGIAILNTDVVFLQIIIDDPTDGIVYDRTVNMQNASVNDWYEFYFEEVIRDTDAVLLDLPAYPAATIRILADNTGSVAAVGAVMVGAQKNLGATQYGTSSGIIDYSQKATDAFGNISIQQRSYSKRANYNVKTEIDATGSVQNDLTLLRSTPAVWVGDKNLSSTFVYGFIKDFEITMTDPVWADISIQVEGLT